MLRLLHWVNMTNQMCKKCAKVSLCWKGTKVTWNRGSNNLASSHNNSSRASYLNSVNYCNTLHFFNKVFDKASIQMFPIIPLLLWHSTQQVNGQSFRFAYCFKKISPLSFQIEYLRFSHLLAGLSTFTPLFSISLMQPLGVHGRKPELRSPAMILF